MRLVTNKSKNLFDYHKASKILGAATLSKQSDFTLIATQTHKNEYTSVEVELDKSFVGKTVTLSALAKTSSINNPNLRIQWFKSDGLATGKMIETKNTSASSDFVQISVTGTVPENPGDGDYLCLCFYSNKDIDLSSSTESSFSSIYKDIQLEIGTEVTTYQPHTWNLLNKWQYPATQIVKGVTFTNNGDGKWTISGKSTSSYSYYNLLLDLPLTQGHTYFNPHDIGNSYVEIKFKNKNDEVQWGVNRYTADENSRVDVGLIALDTFDGADTVLIPQLYDLTLMYGAGNEPTTVDQFYTDHPELKVSPLGFIELKNLEINNKNIKRLKYQTGTKKNLFNINNYSIIGEDIGFDISGLEIGKTYTISCNQSNFKWIKISNSPDGYNSVATHPVPYNKSSFTFVMSRNSNIPETATQYIFLQMMNSTSSGFARNLSELGVNQIQIEEGSTATFYVDYNGCVDLGIIPSNSGYILNKYDNLSEKLLEENVEKDTVNYHIPDKTNILLNKVEGKTNKIVQLIDKSKFQSTQTVDGVTFTNNGKGTYTVNGKSTASGEQSSYTITSGGLTGDWLKGHKYLFYLSDKTDLNYSALIGGYSSFPWSELGYTVSSRNPLWEILTAKESSVNEACAFNLQVKSGVTCTNELASPQLFDLTAMYGFGNEPTTVDQFKKDYPQFFDEKLDGIWNVKTSGISTTGENIYGLEDFIKKNNASDMIVTYDGKKCFKISRSFNPTYYFPLGNYSLNFKLYSTYKPSFCSYGKYENGKYTAQQYVGDSTSGNWENSHYNLTDCNYIKWYNEVPSDKVLYVDIDSFSLSVGINDTNSYTYQENKIDLLSTQELNGINGVNDYIEVIDKGNGLYDLKKTQNIDSVDLGTLNWATETVSSGVNFYSTYTSDKVALSSYPMCQKYTSSSDAKYRNSVFFGRYSGALNITADGYDTATAFKTAMNGVILYYQLKTPITTTIATNLTYNQVSAIRTNGGLLLVNDNNNKKYVQPNVTIKDNYQYKS